MPASSKISMPTLVSELCKDTTNLEQTNFPTREEPVNPHMNVSHGVVLCIYVLGKRVVRIDILVLEKYPNQSARPIEIFKN